ncbi:nitroreductase family deazaflavin-dependent oxidoreductase [Rathayibacter soli]|uniref:nitroreductase family deazaflavin-dependent oxidoreductase n=1 Tax=Rathayibacter soli TaxID=3144168 RepID=UPI0027E5883E|nr:nitroreductase family deazaflavin-dependent oxidoreductase [Glaciibacter superstes]
MTDVDRNTVQEFRANKGQVGGALAGTPLILIHHIGARSRIERVTPLVCSPQDDGTFAIVASNGGSVSHPAWYYNVMANPSVIVEFESETFSALAEEVTGQDRDRLWPALLAGSPSLTAFDESTERSIPLILLRRHTP